jgi:hypothetical protein
MLKEGILATETKNSNLFYNYLFNV